MATFATPQDKALAFNQAQNGRLEMNFRYIAQVRDAFPKNSKNWKTANDILNKAMERREVTNNQLNLLSYLYTKV